MAKIAATMCRTPQEGWCPARHQDEAASAAVVVKRLCARTENITSLKNTQVENVVEVEVIKVESTCSDIASLTQQSALSDSSLTPASAAREKETQDSSKSEAEL